MGEWATSEQAVAEWADAGSLAPDHLERILAAAQEQAERYAPALADEDDVPTRYSLAVIAQARELYAASQRDSQDVIGVGDYAIRARPLTAHVKQLLRPGRARPRIG